MRKIQKKLIVISICKYLLLIDRPTFLVWTERAQRAEVCAEKWRYYMTKNFMNVKKSTKCYRGWTKKVAIIENMVDVV